MPNKKGGKKYKRQKKAGEPVVRALKVKKEEGEEYGLVIKELGSRRFTIECADGRNRLGQLRKGMRRSVRVRQDDWVLIGKRDYETSDEKCDILCKYNLDEVKRLKKLGELISFTNFNLEESNEENDEDIAFDFDDI